MNREQYKEYLKTDHWQSIRLIILKKAEYKCNGCLLSLPLDVHHLTYERLGNEDINDLIALCRECHYFCHEKWATVFKIIPCVRALRILTVRACRHRVGIKIKNSKSFNTLPLKARLAFGKANPNKKKRAKAKSKQ